MRDRRETIDALVDLETATALLDARDPTGDACLLPVVRASGLGRRARAPQRVLDGSELAELVRREPWAEAALEDVVDPDARMLGTLLHDVGKADGRATGAAAWNDWVAELVGSLVTKVRAVLDEQSPEDIAEGAAHTREEAVELATELGAGREEVTAHLDLLPDRYAAAVSPRAVVRHTLMCRRTPDETEIRSRVIPGGEDPEGRVGVDELDVVAPDHPGWFATVTGVVALHGGSVVAADAFTRGDGIAVDTFRVEPPPEITGAWWARVEGDLAEAAAGRLAVRARVLRMARGERRRLARRPEVPTRISTGLDPSGSATLVEVRTLDRLGALYDIATALAELHLDLVVARVQTIGHEVVDAFHLRNARGQPLDGDHLAELDLAIRSALEVTQRGDA